MRGRNKPWAKDFIAAHEELRFNKEEKLEKPLTLEVGIGKGDFIVANAKDNTDYIHIGVELNESIYAIAMKKIVNEGIDNIKMLNCRALDLLELINEGSIEKVYLNFSDPWPKDRHAKRRLTSRQFLARYDQFLKKSGEIIFKTDNKGLFDFSLEEVKEAGWNLVNYTYDLHNSEYVEGNVMTEYEEKFVALGNKINRLVANR